EHLAGGIFMRSTRIVPIVILSFLLVETPAVRADAPLKPLAILDVFNLQLAADPQISPDGKRIVYVRQFNDIMADQRHSNLWIINADGSEHRPLTTGNFNDVSPRWSPDGKQIAYTSNRDGGVQIYRRWLDGGQTAKVTSLPTAPSGIGWSPDGKWISF